MCWEGDEEKSVKAVMLVWGSQKEARYLEVKSSKAPQRVLGMFFTLRRLKSLQPTNEFSMKVGLI